MAVELAVGYVSLVSDASRIPGEIDRALGRAGRNADRAGESMGRRLASGVGKTLKVGAAAAGVAAGGVIATALTKGLGRLTAIDDAQGKLRGLGHDSQAISTIMDSALASVKGTAFGLGEAATAAAGAVAAGIKPGEELTAHLTRVADAATIAGVGVGEMGAIFNKVATSNKIQGDVIAQLSDQGIPIVQLLAAELGKTGEEVYKLASDGKIGFEQFSSAMQKGLGGAALEGGNTVSGALANMNAALGRLGAAALAPTFDRLTGGFGSVTEAIDEMTERVGPAAERLDAVLFNKVIPRAGEMWASFADSSAADTLLGAVDRAAALVGELASVAADAGPAVASIATSLAQASGALGISAWSILLSTLEAAATIADSVLVPALDALAGVMDSNQAAVTALIAGLLVFRTIPRLFGPAAAAMTGMATRAATAATAVGAITTATGRISQVAGVGAVQMGRFGSAVGQLGTHAPVIARMQGAYLGAAAGATRFGRAAGTASAAAVGMRSAASGLTSALGGPMVLALVAATVAVVGIASEVRKAAQQQDILRESTTKLAISQREMARAFQDTEGAVSNDVLASVSGQVEEMLSNAERLADTAPGALSVFTGGFADIRGWFSGHAQAGTDAVRAQERLAEQGEAVRDSFREIGLSSEELAAALSGSDAEFNRLATSLRETSNGGGDAVQKIIDLRAAFIQARDIAVATTPGFFELSDAVKVLADESAGASEQLDAMKSALDVLSGAPVDAQEALSEFNEQVRETAQLAEAWDAAGGFGEDLIDSGQVNTSTENGKKLFDTLLEIRDAAAKAALAGNDLGPILDSNRTQFEQLAAATGLEIEQIEQLAQSIGLVPEHIKILAALEGAEDVDQKLAAIALQLDATGEGVEIPTTLLDAELRAALAEIGLEIDTLTGNPHITRIEAETDEAKARLQALIDTKLPDKTQRVVVEYEDRGQALTRQGLPAGFVGPVAVQPRAHGGIDNLPGQATIQSPSPYLVQWAEPETGGEAFIPLAASKRARSTSILSQVAESFGLSLVQMADGGVPRGVARALAGARSVSGNTYAWGGTGPTNFDCSGFVGWLQQLMQGITGSTRRLYTTYSLLDGATAGLLSGRGPNGTFLRVGVNQEHMAATLDGQPVEAGGSHATSRIGAPAVGADDGQFTAQFYLPNSAIEGIDAAWADPSGSRVGGKGRNDEQDWTESDELRLEESHLSVEEARTRRAEVHGDADSSDLERRRADLRVRQAEQDLIDLQTKKDDALSSFGGDDDVEGPAPEAPALERRLDDDEISWERAILARDESRVSRNETYADPESTDLDLRRADLALQAAENDVDELARKESPTGLIGEQLQKLRTELFGVLGDAVSEVLPFGLGDLLNVQIKSPDEVDDFRAGNPFMVGLGPFPQWQIDRQLPVTPGDDPRKALEPYLNRAPLIIQEWLKPLPLRVFDSGGWLEPGEAAINLTNRPEPIFNSPRQLAQFASQLDIAPRGEPSGGDTFNVVNNGMDPRGVGVVMERVWRRRTLASQRKGGFTR